MTRGAPGYIGPYRLLNVVHTGHASMIWQAYDDQQQRIVGIKTLLNNVEPDREQVKFLYREFIVGQRIQHPNIIGVYASEWDLKQPYFAMEWFSAPNMKQRLLQGGAEEGGAADPQDDRPGRPGARLLPSGRLDSSQRQTGQFPGRRRGPGQNDRLRLGMAPVRASPCGCRFDRRSKAPAAIFRPSKSAAAPWTGGPTSTALPARSMSCSPASRRLPAAGANELLNRHLHATPPSLEGGNPNITADFSRLIRRCLSKKPDGRPESVGDFLREFRMMRVFKRNRRSQNKGQEAKGQKQ